MALVVALLVTYSHGLLLRQVHLLSVPTQIHMYYYYVYILIGISCMFASPYHLPTLQLLLT